ncbi:Ribosomal RNA large subunit methyltransferase J [Trichostrongylus colubriformis]|uniref:Cap-specific mRNA (nucleoside-2'-O-)-methyltransferase 2 n=1 Tax=Trichostrongylus colubriformis TaxID=6319 RepID=A0AAN8ITC1_TRICO
MVASPENTLTASASVDREYCIRSRGHWCDRSPSPSTPLDSISVKLKGLKEQIGAICAESDSLRRWRLHTQTTHPLSAAPKILRQQFNCNATSQAYCKFLEILVRYPRLLHIHPSCRCMRSFHLCEAPGHFISVLDRFLCTFYSKMDWYWEANSLNPHHEGTSACDMLLADEMITGQLERWHFGQDSSGDITKWNDDYITSLVNNGCFHLVTADGSLYTQDAPGDQESKTLPLLESELNIALQLLANGGSFIFKIYTLYMSKTRQLISSVISHFDDVYVFKPMSSKGGNSERYLICMGFSRNEPKNPYEVLSNSLLLDCEAYFSGLQSSFIRANLDTFNTITKAEIGNYRDCVFREFHKRALTSYIANPLRASHLNHELLQHPWTDLFGQNYVETLRQICDESSAIEFLKNFLRTDLMTEHETIGTVEVEFAEDELEFLEWPLEALLNVKVIVAAPPIAQIVHSLFIPSGLLRSLRIWNSEAFVDLCCFSASDVGGDSHYLQSLEFSGMMSVDAYQLRSQNDWCSFLRSIMEGVQKEKISEVELVWSASSTPFVLSRFSASVIAMLCVMFFQFRFGGQSVLATFSKPNYSEDIPSNLESYLCMLTSEALSERGCLHCFVPLCMLEMLHPYLLDLNRRQWQFLLSTQVFTSATTDDMEI